MALVRTTFLLAAILAVAHCQITSPVNGRPVTVAKTGTPTQTPSKQSTDPEVHGPNQVFGGKFNGETPDAAGIDNGKPVFEQGITSGVLGRKLQNWGRKMLQNLPTKGGTLLLDGSGVSAGDQTAGVAANAFGHGETQNANGKVTQNHFEPHGANYAVTANGQQYSGTAGANPDGLAGEGPIVDAKGRK